MYLFIFVYLLIIYVALFIFIVYLYTFIHSFIQWFIHCGWNTINKVEKPLICVCISSDITVYLNMIEILLIRP